MSSDPVGSLSELELDALWTLYEGHSLVIERPGESGQEASAHVILSIAYDESEEAVAEVAEIPLETVEGLIERGYLERSHDGPVLDAHSWFDEELGKEVSAEEFLLSDLGRRVIDDTADTEESAATDALPGRNGDAYRPSDQLADDRGRGGAYAAADTDDEDDELWDDLDELEEEDFDEDDLDDELDDDFADDLEDDLDDEFDDDSHDLDERLEEED